VQRPVEVLVALRRDALDPDLEALVGRGQGGGGELGLRDGERAAAGAELEVMTRTAHGSSGLKANGVPRGEERRGTHVFPRAKREQATSSWPSWSPS